MIKKILFAIVIWFVFQLMVISFADATHSLADAQAVANGTYETLEDAGAARCDVKHINLPFFAFGALLLPLSATSFVTGEWCWEK